MVTLAILCAALAAGLGVAVLQSALLADEVRRVRAERKLCHRCRCVVAVSRPRRAGKTTGLRERQIHDDGPVDYGTRP